MLQNKSALKQEINATIIVGIIVKQHRNNLLWALKQQHFRKIAGKIL